LIRLEQSFREKPWGATNLEPWFPTSDRKIGEVWMLADQRLPILVKFLFTSDKLSVQVHPDDTFASANGDVQGKTEMWHVLRAEPGAAIALGFEEPITRERLREASLSGEIEHLLRWFPVKAGDSFFTPPGTVHAIGAGIALCEIQQQSDVTYRLYDYGSTRELHLDKAMAVSSLGPHPGQLSLDRQASGKRLLASCPYFETELIDLAGPVQHSTRPSEILIFLSGSGHIGNSWYRAGEAWLADPSQRSVRLEPDEPGEVLRTYVP
jgi:mannose-6-phosphate isomerase